jgi:hypothetical protein
MDSRKNDCEGGMGEGPGHYEEGHWGYTASHMCCFFSGSFMKGSHVCISSVFLNIPAEILM